MEKIGGAIAPPAPSVPVPLYYSTMPIDCKKVLFIFSKYFISKIKGIWQAGYSIMQGAMN